MITICYYVSDYGYGHATRSLALIKSLLNQRTNLRIIICNYFAFDFIKSTFINSLYRDRVTFRKVKNDLGYILEKNSIEPDVERFRKKYQRFIGNAQEYVSQEKDFLLSNKVDLVIGDIPPFPFKAAKEIKIPSIGISNFTWYTAYGDWLSNGELEHLSNAYQEMDYFFELAGGREPLWGSRDNDKYGFYSRMVDPLEVNRIRSEIEVYEEDIIVYFGLGMKIDVDGIDSYKLWNNKNCKFIVSSNTNIQRENIYKIPKDYTDSQNYIAASDIVISKPGWGTIGEAIQSNRPLIIVEREGMKEDQNTINYLKQNNRCYLISYRNLKELNIDNKLLNELKVQLTNKDKIPEKTLEEMVGKIITLI